MGPADGGSVHLSALLCPLQADRQYDVPPQHRLPKQPKDGFLVEQVFSPHPHPASLRAPGNNPLYTNMRRTELAEVKRGPPSWTVEDFAWNAGDKGKLTALDLQVSLWWNGVSSSKVQVSVKNRKPRAEPSSKGWCGVGESAEGVRNLQRHRETR